MSIYLEANIIDEEYGTVFQVNVIANSKLLIPGIGKYPPMLIQFCASHDQDRDIKISYFEEGEDE